MSKEFTGFAAAPETITAALGRRRRRLWCKPEGGNVSSFGFVLLDILHSLRSFLNDLSGLEIPTTRSPSQSFPRRTRLLLHGCLLLRRMPRRTFKLRIVLKVPPYLFTHDNN